MNAVISTTNAPGSVRSCSQLRDLGSLSSAASSIPSNTYVIIGDVYKQPCVAVISYVYKLLQMHNGWSRVSLHLHILNRSRSTTSLDTHRAVSSIQPSCPLLLLAHVDRCRLHTPVRSPGPMQITSFIVFLMSSHCHDYPRCLKETLPIVSSGILLSEPLEL